MRFVVGDFKKVCRGKNPHISPPFPPPQPRAPAFYSSITHVVVKVKEKNTAALFPCGVGRCVFLKGRLTNQQLGITF